MPAKIGYCVSYDVTAASTPSCMPSMPPARPRNAPNPPTTTSRIAVVVANAMTASTLVRPCGSRSSALRRRRSHQRSTVLIGRSPDRGGRGRDVVAGCEELAGDEPVAHRHRARAVPRDPGVVGHDDERGARVAGRAREDVEHLGAGRLVEGARRLVGEDDARRPDEGARDRDALGLPAGELARPALLHPGEAEVREPAGGDRGGLCAGRAGEHERQRRVLDGGQLGQELSGLEDEAEVLAPQDRAPRLRERRDVLAAPRHRAGRRRDDTREAVQEGRLAGPGRAHDGERLAGVHREAHAREGVRRGLGGAVDLGERARDEGRAAGDGSGAGERHASIVRRGGRRRVGLGTGRRRARVRPWGTARRGPCGDGRTAWRPSRRGLRARIRFGIRARRR